MKRATEKQTMEKACKLMIETSEHCIARKIFIHIKNEQDCNMMPIKA